MSSTDPTKRIRATLERLTGFEHPVFFQNGTAATEAVLSLLSRRGDSIALPALACWTLAYAVTKLHRVVDFQDIDRYWALGSRSSSSGIGILVDPWGAPADWACLTPERPIADMTLAPGALLAGAKPAAHCEAGILSLGEGKPLNIGGGGVALFRDEAHAREARRMLRFGFEDGLWQRRLERYTFSHHLLPVLEQRLDALPSLDRAGDEAERARSVIRSMGMLSNPLRPGARWGYGSVTPLCLPGDFPLTARDVEGVALCLGLKLSRHPVSPAYLEPAWRIEARASCPRAEEIAPYCMFFQAGEFAVDCLPAFFELLLSSPDQFRFPFPLPKPRGALSQKLERLSNHTRLVRDLEGRYGLVDESEGLLWSVDEREAAILQAKSEASALERAEG